jgi:hypothetical protein
LAYPREADRETLTRQLTVGLIVPGGLKNEGSVHHWHLDRFHPAMRAPLLVVVFNSNRKLNSCAEFKPMSCVRICFLALAVLISTGMLSAFAQLPSSTPRSPAEIAAASRRLAEKNESCRQQARDQKLTFLKRRRFVRGCRKGKP